MSGIKSIATINFKGGVGKTTCTWALGDIAAKEPNKHSLLFDLDAQMSLTQAIALNEDGDPFKSFTDWYERAVRKEKTIFHAMDEYAKPEKFEFGINDDFIYKITNRYHFVPSSDELYWTELDIYDKDKIKHFIHTLLAKIANSKNVPSYDYAFFDCPPSFSLLSYSILSCCNMILVPINPDFFAAKGLGLLLSSLRYRIEPLPVPKIGVFMNRAKRPGGTSSKKFSNETSKYLNDARDVLRKTSDEFGLKTKLFDTAIFDMVGMKRAIQQGMPTDFSAQFSKLWSEIKRFLEEK